MLPGRGQRVFALMRDEANLIRGEALVEGADPDRRRTWLKLREEQLDRPCHASRAHEY